MYNVRIIPAAARDNSTVTQCSCMLGPPSISHIITAFRHCPSPSPPHLPYIEQGRTADNHVRLTAQEPATVGTRADAAWRAARLLAFRPPR